MLFNCGPRELLRVPWTARRSNQSILKEISPEYSLERLTLKLKLQYFGHLMWKTDSLEDSDAGKDWRQEEKGTTEDEMVGWHHQLDGPEFEHALGVGDGQGSLVCCSPWDHKELGTTERLIWNELKIFKMITTVSIYHLSTYKDVTWLLTIFPTLFISYPWLICFVTGSWLL